MPFTPEPTPGGRWRGGFKHPVTGKKVRKTFDYSYEAEAWAIVAEQKAKDDAAADQDQQPTDQDQQPATQPARKVVKIGPTLGEYGRAYLDRRRGLIAKATHKKYQAAHTGLSIAYPNVGVMADRPMTMIRKRELEQWMTDQVDAGVGPWTVNSRLTLVRRLFLDIITDETDIVEADPTATIALLPTGVPDDRILTPAEDEALLAAADPVHRVAFMVALDAGLRWQETYALKVSDLDFRDNGTSYVGVSGVLERDSVTIRPWPKGKRPRTPVPMTERLETALRDLVAGKGRGDLLFPNSAGQPWAYSSHRKRIWSPTLFAIGEAKAVRTPTARLRKYGPNKGEPYEQLRYVPNFGFHQLRHTFGSRMADAGIPRSEIAVLMDHSDERTTKRYIHAGDDGRRFAMVREAEQRRRREATA